MTRFRATIHHPPTRQAILSYLALQGGPVSLRRLSRYMALMHSCAAGATRFMLARMVARGIVQRQRRGVYVLKGAEQWTTTTQSVRSRQVNCSAEH